MPSKAVSRGSRSPVHSRGVMPRSRSNRRLRVTSPVSTALRGGQLLRVRLTPVRDLTGEVSGFVLVLEDHAQTTAEELVVVGDEKADALVSHVASSGSSA